jgi:hypothetical protein
MRVDPNEMTQQIARTSGHELLAAIAVRGLRCVHVDPTIVAERHLR